MPWQSCCCWSAAGCASPRSSRLIGAGVIAGPAGMGLLKSEEDVDLLAEIGVALLLFTAGLEFSLNELRRMWRTILPGGLAQVAFTARRHRRRRGASGGRLDDAACGDRPVRRAVEHGGRAQGAGAAQPAALAARPADGRRPAAAGHRRHRGARDRADAAQRRGRREQHRRSLVAAGPGRRRRAAHRPRAAAAAAAAWPPRYSREAFALSVRAGQRRHGATRRGSADCRWPPARFSPG